MYIKKIDKEKKEILVAIPLTTTSGKTRVKERDNIYGYGIPFASRTKLFNQKNYIEWQIGYDAEKPNNLDNYKKTNFKSYENTTLKNVNFVAYNTKTKALYELSEYLYYLVDFKVVKLNELKELKSDIQRLSEDKLIDKHHHCAIKRTHPNKEIINKIDFEILKVEYPQLIHKFKKYEIITEITVREKQRAIGVQPMLYFCFPITELESENQLIGRCAEIKEFANFKINEDNSFIILEMVKIFGMLSPSHKYDTVEILDLIIKSFEK
tara:strand:- start:209 stop:1009 length:801 start_codon:yes stop_codon:yes gene_type:complete